MKTILYIFIVVSLFSCSSVENKKYHIFKKYLKDENTEKEIKEICNTNHLIVPDTIFINTLKLANRNFYRYIFLENKLNDNDLSIWINCKDKKTIKKIEIDKISNFVIKEKFNKSKLTFDKFKATQSLDKNVSNLNTIHFNFSEPIMILEKKYFIFYSECVLNVGQKQFYFDTGYKLMKKNKNGWVYIGKLCENNIID